MFSFQIFKVCQINQNFKYLLKAIILPHMCAKSHYSAFNFGSERNNVIILLSRPYLTQLIQIKTPCHLKGFPELKGWTMNFGSYRSLKMLWRRPIFTSSQMTQCIKLYESTQLKASG